MAALQAGAVAIISNMLVLSAADLIPLATAHGGLLRLLVILSNGVIPIPTDAYFQMAFHIVVGFAMAFVYAFALQPFLPGPSWGRGLLYALIVWLANAFLVLPAIGEGIAGIRHLSLAGIIWFAGAHTLFFVLLAVLYAEALCRQIDKSGHHR